MAHNLDVLKPRSKTEQYIMIRFLSWLLLLGLSLSAAAEPPTIRLGVPPWQGAEAKSAVVAEILRGTG